MLIHQRYIEDPDGNIMITHIEDHSLLAKANHEEKMENAGWTKDRTMRQILRVPARIFYMWEKREPGCWDCDAFKRSFLKENPEYSTVKRGTF